MRAGVLGAGPVGVVCAVALARRGHEVLLVDRDPGPAADGSWQRQGVMQFLHPHFFRPQVRMVLDDLVPGAWDALVAAGGVPARQDGMPPGLTGLACRRSVVEATLRRVADAEPGVRRVTGYVDDVLLEGGRAAGVLVDGSRVELDLVLDTTGRSGRLHDDRRPPVEGGACGFSYVSRMYRARPGAEVPEGFPRGAEHDGYLGLLLPQDDRTFSVLVVRASDDDRLAGIRHQPAWDAFVAAVPGLAPWTDPDGYDPITPVLPGGGLTNTFRRQVDDDHPAVPGLLFLGDTVSTTNPSAGRGVSLGMLQAQALLGLLDGPDTVEAAERFDAWCTGNLRPWYDDHVLSDRTTLARWRGEDLDVDGPLPTDVVCRAAEVDPSIMEVAGPYMGMAVLPTALDQVADKVRAVLRTGWRPQPAPGPSLDELAELTVAAV